MILELHLIQNFAPSNLNRSDTGSPKDCIFGGVRRARISSQCFKRAIRWESDFQAALESSGGSVRTRRLIAEITNLVTNNGHEREKVLKLVSDIFNAGGIERRAKKGGDGDSEDTKLVIFMNKSSIAEMAQLIKDNLEELSNKETKEVVIKKLGEALTTSVKSPDVALFGRMLEIEPSKPFGKLNLGVNAASQVAHAISTHKVGLDFDYFTAVDDLLGSGEVGAGMLGTIEFNSACFYRYANINIDLLKKNLGDDELTQKTVKAFIQSATNAIPKGKQTWSATHEKPSLVYAVVRNSGMMSLANAFEKPVHSPNGGLVDRSIEALAEHYVKVTGVYGDGAKSRIFITTGDAGKAAALGENVGTFDSLLDRTMSAIFNGREG